MDALEVLADDVLKRAAKRGRRLATAESCTGGLVMAHLTAIPGSSTVAERGYVTYSNEAKTEALGVPRGLLARDGAVSESVARAMAEGALERSRAHLAVAITGVAGPGGGGADKPVGLVWFALAGKGRSVRTLERRFGDVGRARVRALSVAINRSSSRTSWRWASRTGREALMPAP